MSNSFELNLDKNLKEKFSTFIMTFFYTFKMVKKFDKHVKRYFDNPNL